MSGQRRALAVVLLLGALTLPGCAATVDPGLPCELPDDTQLVAGDDGGYLVVYDDGTMYDLAFANGRCVINQRRLAIPRAERSDADLIFLYDYYRLRLGPCLDLYGYSYLAPPSREDFVASGGNWSLRLGVPGDAECRGPSGAQQRLPGAATEGFIPRVTSERMLNARFP